MKYTVNGKSFNSLIELNDYVKTHEVELILRDLKENSRVFKLIGKESKHEIILILYNLDTEKELDKIISSDPVFRSSYELGDELTDYDFFSVTTMINHNYSVVPQHANVVMYGVSPTIQLYGLKDDLFELFNVRYCHIMPFMDTVLDKHIPMPKPKTKGKWWF